MGQMNAISMAECVAEGLLSLEAAIQWQLRSNHYPPYPRDLEGPAATAVRLCNAGQHDAVVELPERCATPKARPEARAWEIVAALRLEPFVRHDAPMWGR